MTNYKGLLTFALAIWGFQTQAQNILFAVDSANIPDVELGEIVIAASRDNTVLKDLPSAVSSIRTGKIEGNQILSLEDINTYVPNFLMLDYGTKLTSPVYIRGIGSKKGAPAVGLYVDGVPQFDFSSFNFDFYDIASIEVLRGPQGTLYGRNSMGGLINVNTLSPSTYQGTRLRLSSGSYGHQNATLSHYAKVGNDLAFSLSANYRKEDGYFENKTLHTMADELESYGLRNRLIYKFTDQLKIENIASYENSTQGGYPFAVADSSGEIGDVAYNQASSYDRILFNDGLSLNYTGKEWTADMILSYQMIDDQQEIDQDFTADSSYFVVQNQKQNMYSAEGIVRSHSKQKYQWLFGTFAFKQDMKKDVSVDIYAYNSQSLKYYDNDITSFGIFHQSTLSLTSRLKLSAGLRYNFEKSLLDYQYDVVAGGSIVPQVDSLYPSLEEHILLPKLALSYATDALTLYASYATGYKAGGFNSTFERAEDLQYEKEMSHNYELGAKASLFDGRVFADAAIFSSFITGQQISRSVPSGQGTFLQNAGESRNNGLEFSVSTQAIHGFELSASYGYTDAHIIKYEVNDSLNYNGHTAPYIPKHTMNLMGAKSFSINGNYLERIRLQLDYQLIGHSYWRIENDLEQDAYSKLNALITLDFEVFKIDLWGKNLSNTQYASYAVESLGETFYQKGQPRRFGATIALNF